MDQTDTSKIVYDEKTLKQLEDDDPGISWLESVKKTLPLVNGFGGKVRALSLAVLRLLP